MRYNEFQRFSPYNPNEGQDVNAYLEGQRDLVTRLIYYPYSNSNCPHYPEPQNQTPIVELLALNSTPKPQTPDTEPVPSASKPSSSRSEPYALSPMFRV